jgi:hypothetical protein
MSAPRAVIPVLIMIRRMTGLLLAGGSPLRGHLAFSQFDVSVVERFLLQSICVMRSVFGGLFQHFSPLYLMIVASSLCTVVFLPVALVQHHQSFHELARRPRHLLSMEPACGLIREVPSLPVDAWEAAKLPEQPLLQCPRSRLALPEAQPLQHLRKVCLHYPHG